MPQKNFLILVSGILKNNKGEILLLRRSDKNNSYQGCWQLPEGKIEFDEQPEEALRREIKEETGLDLVSSDLVFAISTRMTAKGVDYHVVRIVYEVECKGSVKLSQDHNDSCWFDIYNAVLPDKKIGGLEKVLDRLKG